jgi:aminoglycoside phosphotransferase (APT) family kinase protein
MEIERSIRNIELNEAQLIILVRNAFPNCKKIDNWEILSGGAINTAYKLQIGSHSYILRLYARERAHCKTEKAIYQLIDKSVPTPKLIYADESHEPWAYAIFECISGMHISEVPKKHKTSLSYELGRILASIHSFKFPEAGLFGDGMTIGVPFGADSSPYFEETYSLLAQGKNVRFRLGEKRADRALAFIQENKDFFPTVKKENVCLTHADFKPVNLLYKSTGEVFVLDWEFAHAGVGILDFAVLLRHRHRFPFDQNALRDGYINAGGCLPDEWIRSALITDFVNMVTLLEFPSERPALFHELKNSIQATIEHWQVIDDSSTAVLE